MPSIGISSSRSGCFESTALAPVSPVSARSSGQSSRAMNDGVAGDRPAVGERVDRPRRIHFGSQERRRDASDEGGVDAGLIAEQDRRCACFRRRARGVRRRGTRLVPSRSAELWTNRAFLGSDSSASTAEASAPVMTTTSPKPPWAAASTTCCSRGLPASGSSCFERPSLEDVPAARMMASMRRVRTLRQRPCRAAVISASTERAISSGLTAPMSRPMGAWMRAISSSVKPISRSAARRSSAVLRLPIAPI